MDSVMFDKDLSSSPTAQLLFDDVFALDVRTPSWIRLPVPMLSSSSGLLHPAYLDADNLPVTNWYARPSPLARFLQGNDSDDEENYAADAVEGLLGMAAIGGLRTDMLEGNGVKGGVDEDDDEYGW